MELGHSFGSASGEHHNSCHVLGYRYNGEQGFRPDAGESYVLEFAETNTHSRLVKTG